MSPKRYKFTSSFDSLLHLLDKHGGTLELRPAPTHDYPKGWALSLSILGTVSEARFDCGELPLAVGLNQAAEMVLDGLRVKLSTFVDLAADVDEVSP